MNKKTSLLKVCDILKYRTEIYGLAALLIIYHHLSNRGIPLLDSSHLLSIGGILKFIISKAYLGVDVFVFLSAVCLSFSIQKHGVLRFYFNRFVRVLIPYLIIMLPVYVYEDFIAANDGLLGFVLDITTLRYWFDHAHTNTPWFVPFILLLYIIFPLIFLLDTKTKHISSAFIIVLSLSLVVYIALNPSSLLFRFQVCITRFPVFLAGILSSRYFAKDSKAEIKPPYLIIMSLISITIIMMIALVKVDSGVEKVLLGAVAVSIIFIYSFIRSKIETKKFTKPISTVLYFFGTVSLEIYIVHTVILRIIDNNDVSNVVFALQYIMLPLVSVLLSKLYASITNRLLVPINNFVNLHWSK